MNPIDYGKKVEALKSLKPTAKWSWGGDLVYSELKWNDSSAKPTEAEINAEVTRLETVFSNNEYQRKRKSEYPDYGEQLDKIYHSGLNAWKADIKAIKDKHPMPS